MVLIKEHKSLEKKEGEEKEEKKKEEEEENAVSNRIPITVSTKFEKIIEKDKVDFSMNFRSPPEVRVSPRRWLQVLLFVTCSIINSFQWHQYTIITNVIRRYYGVSSLSIEWTSMIFLVTYMALVFPVSYLIDRVGLRWTVLLGATGTSVGTWIKVFSSSPDRFALTFLGQTLAAISQTFIMPVPGRLSAYWFGPQQIAFATALACFGVHIGFSTCFLLTPIFIRDHIEVDDIGNDLSNFFLTVAISSTTVTGVLFFLFQDQPKFPPSEARALQKINRRENAAEGFLPPVKRILCNKNFIVLWNSYGLILSALCAVTTLVNPLYLAHFKGSEKEVGLFGLLLIASGAVGSVIFAAILDQTKKFRTVPISISVMALFSAILFAMSLIMEIKWQVFLSGVLLGACLIGFASIGYELCAEATYPEPEGIATGILYISPQLYGIILVLISGRLIEYYGDKGGHICICIAVFLGMVLTISNRGELRRQKVERISDYNAVPLGVPDHL